METSSRRHFLPSEKGSLCLSLSLSPTCYIIPLYFMISSSFLSSFRVSHLRFDCQTVIYQSTGGRALTCFSSFLYHTSSKKKNFSRLAKKKMFKISLPALQSVIVSTGGKNMKFWLVDLLVFVCTRTRGSSILEGSRLASLKDSSLSRNFEAIFFVFFSPSALCLALRSGLLLFHPPV